MRGDDEQQGGAFSYVTPEARIPKDHPLTDQVLRDLLQIPYTVRSERLLMEQLDYNIL